MVCVYPLFHMGAWTIALQQWQARDLVAFVPKPDGPAICAAVRQTRCRSTERHAGTVAPGP